MEKEKVDKKTINKTQIKASEKTEQLPSKKEETTSKQVKKQSIDVSDKNFITTLLLCIFFGYLGVHRFYAGKVGTGLIWLFTGGLFGIGYIVDIVIITAQTFEDSSGKIITV